MDLLDLMERPLARRSDPQTSRNAAKDAGRFSRGDCLAILETLRASAVPLAAEQISDALGWGNHVRVNRRLASLVDASLIAPCDDDLHINRSGSKARKYRVLR